ISLKESFPTCMGELAIMSSLVHAVQINYGNLMTNFSTVGLIGHLHSGRANQSLKRLISSLLHRGRCFVLERETATLLNDPDVLKRANQIVDIDDLGKLCDVVVVVGGDGSLLRGARALAKYNVPLLGVNRGRLGFLTDIIPEDIESRIDEVMS